MQGTGNYINAETLAVKKSVGIHGGALGLAILLDGNYLLPTTAETRQRVGCSDEVEHPSFKLELISDLWGGCVSIDICDLPLNVFTYNMISSIQAVG